MTWLFRLALALGLLAPAASLHADQNDPRLDDLFTQLKAADSAEEAQTIEAFIWQIWTEADDAATNTLMELGLMALQSGNLPGALQLFDAVTTQNPDYAEGWNKRATVLFMMGAYEKSAQDVARVLELEPRHFGALSGLGMINLQRGNEAKALEAFERALSVNPHMPAVKANVEALRRRTRQGAI